MGGRWSPDGTKIAFSLGGRTNSAIYVVNVDGTNLKRLTDDAAFTGEVAWSPDGKKIAFISQRDGKSHLYLMNADGSDQRKTSDLVATEPAWSNDGLFLSFSSNGIIYIIKPNGEDLTKITQNDRFNQNPVWLP